MWNKKKRGIKDNSRVTFPDFKIPRADKSWTHLRGFYFLRK